MTEPEPSASEETDGEPAFDEVRAAAGEVIESLKRLIDATERVVADPSAFAGAVEGGRSVVEAFLGGFASQKGDEPGADAPDAAAATAESERGAGES